MVYKKNNQIALYLNNNLEAKKTASSNLAQSISERNGDILVGQLANNQPAEDVRAGDMIVDYITFWDRPITDAERGLL